MQHSELPYWIALAHIPRWPAEKVNRLVIRIIHEKSLSLEDFFNLSDRQWQAGFELGDGDVAELQRAKKELPNNSFLAEDLLAQGFTVIPIKSPLYSEALKENLKAKYAPPVLYVKGNTALLKEPSVAIVGSRNASELALRFTDTIAKKAAEAQKVVVSGFAKGVDRQALDSALAHNGKSIIALPQGIMTFASGFNAYYRHILSGSVLVLSTFHPKAPWSVGLAMARNPIIYGLTREIYVAQSGPKGGTWEGVIDGLRKGRTIYVRSPEQGEGSANRLLIGKGAVAVDNNGSPVISQEKPSHEEHAAEERVLYTVDDFDARILEALKGKALTAKQLIDSTGSDWTPQKLSKHLKGMQSLETVAKTKPLKFKIKADGCRQQALFG